MSSIFDDVDTDEVASAEDEARSGNLRENEAGIPEEIAYDYEQHDAPITRLHPECVVGFDRIVGLSVFNGGDNFLNNRQNLEGAGPKGWGNQVVLTLENPRILDGELWAEDDDFRDYRIIGDPSTEYSPYTKQETVLREDGEVTGVEVEGVDLGMGSFAGQPTDTATDLPQFVQLLISPRRAIDVFGTLDTAGMWAHTEDGELTEGIIETPPNFGTEEYNADEHGNARAIGYPELRSDMVDTPGTISFRFDDDEPTKQSQINVSFTRYDEDADGLVGISALTPEDDAYALPTYPRAGNVFWEHNGTDGDTSGPGAGGAGGANGADAEPTETMADANALADSDPKITYSDLSAAGQEFVEDAVNAVEAKNGGSVDMFDDWDTRCSKFAAGNEQVMATPEDFREIANARIDG